MKSSDNTRQSIKVNELSVDKYRTLSSKTVGVQQNQPKLSKTQEKVANIKKCGVEHLELFHIFILWVHHADFLKFFMSETSSGFVGHSFLALKKWIWGPCTPPRMENYGPAILFKMWLLKPLCLCKFYHHNFYDF